MPAATIAESGRPRSAPTDEELMDRYCGGEAAAFEFLYERYKGTVYRYLRRVTGDRATAEELAQDVWLRLIDARSDYKGWAKLTTWLFTIAHHRLVDYLRIKAQLRFTSQECVHELIDAMGTPDRGPEDLVASKEIAARLRAALADLPPAQREAFLLQQEGELTVEQIAAMTGVGRETAKSRLRYAIAKLRTVVKREREGRY